MPITQEMLEQAVAKLIMKSEANDKQLECCLMLVQAMNEGMIELLIDLKKEGVITTQQGNLYIQKVKTASKKALMEQLKLVEELRKEETDEHSV